MKPTIYAVFLCCIATIIACTTTGTQNSVTITPSPEQQESLLERYTTQNRNQFKTQSNLSGHTKPIRGVAISPDNRWIYTAGRDGKAKKWDALTNEVVLTFDGHFNELFSIDISPDGDKLVTSSRDGEARIWNTATGEQVNRVDCGDGIAWDATFSSGGNTAAVASHDRKVRIWDTLSGEILFILEPGLWAYSCAFANKTNRLVSGHPAIVVVWDSKTGEEIKRLTIGGHENYLKAVAITADGKTVAAGGLDKAVTLFNVESGEEIHKFSGHTGYIESLHFSGDGRYLLSTGLYDKNVFLWDTQSKEIETVYKCVDQTNGAVFSQDEKYIVISMENNVVVFDKKTNKPIREIDIRAKK